MHTPPLKSSIITIAFLDLFQNIKLFTLLYHNFFKKIKKHIIFLAMCLAASFTLAQNNQASNNSNKLTEYKTPPLGQYLASACLACHQGASVYPLFGQNSQVLFEKMNAYASDQQKATIMHQLLKGYNTQQIKAMADYFSEQKPLKINPREISLEAIQQFSPKK